MTIFKLRTEKALLVHASAGSLAPPPVSHAESHSPTLLDGEIEEQSASVSPEPGGLETRFVVALNNDM